MNYELVIFDCDGVLVDSELVGNRVFAEMLAEYGHAVSAEALRDRFRGMKLGDCLEAIRDETGIRFTDTVEAELRDRMASAFRAELKPLPGVKQLVESLLVPFCVASSGPRSKIEQNLQTTKLFRHFSGRIFSGYEVGSWKPDPGLFLAAANHFQAAPAKCVVIEDSEVGVLAGLSANMTVLALDPAENNPSLSSAHRVFQNLDQIRAYLVEENLSRP